MVVVVAEGVGIIVLMSFVVTELAENTAVVEHVLLIVFEAPNSTSPS